MHFSLYLAVTATIIAKDLSTASTRVCQNECINILLVGDLNAHHGTLKVGRLLLQY